MTVIMICTTEYAMYLRCTRHQKQQNMRLLSRHRNSPRQTHQIERDAGQSLCGEGRAMTTCNRRVQAAADAKMKNRRAPLIGGGGKQFSASRA